MGRWRPWRNEAVSNFTEVTSQDRSSNLSVPQKAEQRPAGPISNPRPEALILLQGRMGEMEKYVERHLFVVEKSYGFQVDRTERNPKWLQSLYKLWNRVRLVESSILVLFIKRNTWVLASAAHVLKLEQRGSTLKVWQNHGQLRVVGLKLYFNLKV